MKNKTPYILFVLGALLIITGSVLKIEHSERAGFFLAMGLALEIGAIALFIFRLITTKNEKL